MRLSHRAKLQTKLNKQHYLIVEFADKKAKVYANDIKNISKAYQNNSDINIVPHLLNVERQFTPVISPLKRLLTFLQKAAAFITGVL